MTEPAPKRRLPIVSSSGGNRSSGDDETQDRPPWHWSGIGTAAIFLVWLPLTMIAGYAGSRFIARLGVGEEPSVAADAGVRLQLQIVIATINIVALGIASFAGGFLVGRFGGKAGRKEAAVAGFFAAAVAWALAASQSVGSSAVAFDWALILATIAPFSAAVAYFGGRYGLRRRPPGAR